MTDQRLFLGRPDPNRDWADNPLVRPWDSDPAATWHYGPGGAPGARIVGTTGGGKSSLLRLMLRGLVRKPGPRGIIIIDGEGAGEFTAFKHMPGVVDVINVNPAADRKLPEGAPTSVQRAADAMNGALAEVIDRASEMDQVQNAWLDVLIDPAHHQPPAYIPPGELWVVIDGWVTLRHNFHRYLKAKLDPVEDMTLFARTGRKVDGHLVIADQVTYASRSKDDTGMPSELKKQLGCSIAAVGPLGLTASEGRMAFDDEHAGRLVPKDLGGCLMQIGATRVPFVVPAWLNPTTADPSVSAADRRVAYRLLPSPETAA